MNTIGNLWTGSHPIIWLLLLSFLLAILVFIDRLVAFRKATKRLDAWLPNLKSNITLGKIQDAMQSCEDLGGTIPTIIQSGLQKHDYDRIYIENALEIAGAQEIAKLEKNTQIIATIAHLAPLMGLLGTVLGFIEAFSEMRQSGFMDLSAGNIGGAMEFALSTTAAGLFVAIPCLLAYNYLVGKIASLTLNAQTIATEILDLITKQQKKS